MSKNINEAARKLFLCLNVGFFVNKIIVAPIDITDHQKGSMYRTLFQSPNAIPIENDKLHSTSTIRSTTIFDNREEFEDFVVLPGDIQKEKIFVFKT